MSSRDFRYACRTCVPASGSSSATRKCHQMCAEAEMPITFSSSSSNSDDWMSAIHCRIERGGATPGGRPSIAPRSRATAMKDLMLIVHIFYQILIISRGRHAARKKGTGKTSPYLKQRPAASIARVPEAVPHAPGKRGPAYGTSPHQNTPEHPRTPEHNGCPPSSLVG